ncbi:hypothetical protein NLJ89_g5755 [Agrocybe chaxingu]|uniref:Uncharacterized protein n=1 Tax=Agrocybe chaxingu TaxID=84603 RepID=A0A9W8K065_9AGAR|nr:hypothetical protein NLJ89_g5755 [Agrocybe chaxingu]
MKVPRLSTELFDLILDDVADDPDAIATLKACSCANSTLCDLSQKRLFRDLELDCYYYPKNPGSEITSITRQHGFTVCERRTPRSFGHKFLDLIYDAGKDNGRFLGYVKTLTVIFPNNAQIERSARESDLVLPRLLPLLPNLQEITLLEPLSISEWRETASPITEIPWNSLENDLRLTFLTAFQRPPLKHLDLGRVEDLPACCVESFSPMLETLVISSFYFDYERHGSKDGLDKCPNCRGHSSILSAEGRSRVVAKETRKNRPYLKRLRFEYDSIDRMDMIADTIELLCDPLFPFDLSRLTTLEIALATRDEETCFDCILEKCANTLEHLHIESSYSIYPYPSDDTPETDPFCSLHHINLLSTIPNLQTFSIEFIICAYEDVQYSPEYTGDDDSESELELEHMSSQNWLSTIFSLIGENTSQAGSKRLLDEVTIFLEINYSEYSTLPKNWLDFFSVFRSPVMPPSRSLKIEIYCLRAPEDISRREMARLLWENEHVLWLAKERVLTVTALLEHRQQK